MLRWLNNKHHRRYLFVLSASLLLTLVLILPANAQWDPAGFKNSIMNVISDLFLGFGKFFIGSAIFFLKFFIALAQYNNYLDVPTVQIGWIMVRDVANMFFVVALLVIAFGTILGLEQYQWNKTLVKLILAAVFINFSNLICGIFIDVAHVFTITFINAIAGAAGGNLINMFKLTEIYKMVTGGASPQPQTNFPLEVLIGSFAAFIFSLMVALIMGFYALVMLFRVVALWVLIILSPIAFILQVLPETESRAKEWWKQFGNYVLVAPVMVFFMWLAFATLGTGDVVSTLNLKLGENELADVVASQATNKAEGQAEYSGPNALSLNAVTTWENLASFLIPMVLLYVGIQKVQELSVVGGSMLSGALDTVKKVATVASGVGLARWALGKGADAGKSAAGGVGMGLLKGAGYVVGAERIANRFKREIQGFHNWRLDTGYRPVIDHEYIDEETGEKKVVYKQEAVYEKDERTGKFKTDANGEKIAVRDQNGKIVTRNAMEKVAPKFAPLQGWFLKKAQRDVASRKKLEKTENMAKNRAELLDKRTSAVPTSMLMGKGESTDALDRIEQGMLKGEQARSAAKTEEFHAMGQQLILQSGRVQYKDGKPKGGPNQGLTVAEMIAVHKTRAERNQGLLHSIEADAKKRFIEGKFTFGPFADGKRGADGNFSYGKDLMHEIEALEFGKKAADDFVAEIKQKQLSHAMESARARVEEIIDSEEAGGDPEKIKELLKKESEINPFVASLRQARLLKETTQETGIVTKQAEDASYDATVALAQGGRTPSTAMSDEVERIKKEYAMLGRTQAQKLAADRIAVLTAKQTELESQTDEHDKPKRLELRDQIALNAAISAVDMEAWNDDVFDHIFSQIDKLDRTEKGQDGGFSVEEKKGQEYKKALAMKSLADSQGWKFSDDTKDGNTKKISTTYGRSMSSQLQGLAVFGGDSKLLKADSLVDKIRTDDFNERREKIINEHDANWDTSATAVKTKAVGDTETYERIVDQAVGSEELTEIKRLAASEGVSIQKIVEDYGYGDRVASMLDSYANNVVESQLDAQLSGLKEMDYGKAVTKAATEKKDDFGMSEKDFYERIKNSQDFAQTASRTYTKDAYGNAHYESANNIMTDTSLKGGILRRMSSREAQAETNSDLSKKKLTEILLAQKHSAGDIDLNGAHLFRKVDEGQYRGIFSQLKDEYQWSGVNPRLNANLYGYAAGEDFRKRSGKAVFGGASMGEGYETGQEGTKNRGNHILKSMILPEVLGNVRTFLIGLKSNFSHITSQQMNSGQINIDLDGYGAMNDLDDLVKVAENAGTEVISGRDLRRLKRIAKEVKEHGAGIGTTKSGTKPTDGSGVPPEVKAAMGA